MGEPTLLAKTDVLRVQDIAWRQLMTVGTAAGGPMTPTIRLGAPIVPALPQAVEPLFLATSAKLKRMGHAGKAAPSCGEEVILAGFNDALNKTSVISPLPATHLHRTTAG